MPHPDKRDIREHTLQGSQRHLRPYALAVGTVFVAIVSVAVSYSELVASRGGSIDAVLLGATHMPPGALAGLVILLAISGLFGRISRRLRITPPEATLIYYMMATAALISSFGLTAQLLPNLVAVDYLANRTNEWSSLFRHIPRWLTPWDPQGQPGQPVARWFYEGLKHGEPIPWRQWVAPLAAWTALALLMFFFMACLATLVRRQWADSERLSFPLVQLPVEMAQSTQTGFLSRRATWLGALVPFVIHGLNGLHANYPQWPSIPTSIVLNDFFVSKPLSDVYYTPVIVAFSVIGFSFLLPLDVSFSFWFFLLFFRAQDIAASEMGMAVANAPLYPARLHIAYQSAGAFFAIVGCLLYLSRSQISTVTRCAFFRRSQDAEADEFMSYRGAFWGMIVSFCLIVGWCTLAGMSMWVAAAVMAIFLLVIVVVLTRAVAEVGLLMLQPVFRPTDILAMAAPTASLGPANVTLLALLSGVFFRDPRTLMPVFLDSMKGAGLTGGRRRNMWACLVCSILVAVATSYLVQLGIIYRTGGLQLNHWFLHDNPEMHMIEASNILRGGVSPNPSGPAWFGMGAITTLFLYWMRIRFWWWPFHPMGYAMGAAWPAIVYWFAFLIGWISKAFILRYGGVRLFLRARPFFLGLILGEFAAAVFWTFLTAAFGLRSPSIALT